MPNTVHRIQCRCGQLEGQLASKRTMRFVCYCRDCQAYAHALGNPAVLDERGGTDVIATVQQDLRFTRGIEHLACLTLSGRIYRWYASCCDTPIGNTARDPHLSYIAVVHSCLGSPAALDADFGTERIPVNTKRTKGKRDYSTAGAMFSIARLIGAVMGARITGKWKNTPFFDGGTTMPVVAARRLDADARQRAYDAADAERAARMQGG